MSLSESARSLIHTLTLAIGHGTDAQTTARTFLVTLVKHCPLDGAALWWRDALAPPETPADLVLLATEPAQLDTAVRLPGRSRRWLSLALAAGSISIPSQADRAHTCSRTAAACSPMPPVNTSASSPPSAAASEPSSRAIR